MELERQDPLEMTTLIARNQTGYPGHRLRRFHWTLTSWEYRRLMMPIRILPVNCGFSNSGKRPFNYGLLLFLLFEYRTRLERSPSIARIASL